MQNNTFYITNEGLDKMMREFQNLEKEKNRKLKQEVRILGGIKKSDPDYINSFEEINFIKKRINEIKNIIVNARLINPAAGKNNTVGLGAKVTLLEEGSKKFTTLKIVDSVEVNPADGKISRYSPMGSALMGHKTKEIIFVRGPINRNYFIKKIEYKSN
jgi:transcription elongation factor GreA